jgi:hypothetical protein
VVGTVPMGRAHLTILIDFPIIEVIQTCKISNWYFSTPKISKVGMVVDKFKWNIFPFGEKFKFQMDFETKNYETNPI